jgi:hypothetical protein
MIIASVYAKVRNIMPLSLYSVLLRTLAYGKKEKDS